MALAVPCLQLESEDVTMTKVICRKLLMALGNNQEFDVERQTWLLIMLLDHLKSKSKVQIEVVIREGLVPRLVGTLDVMQAYHVDIQVASLLN